MLSSSTSFTTMVAPSIGPTKPPPSPIVPCKVVLLSPKQATQWDDYVLSHPHGTLFHTLSWRDAVKEAFRHEAIYLAAHREGKLVGVLPLFYVPSRLAGRMLVSVPYGVGGGIIADDDEVAAALFAAARQEAAERSCMVIDLRSREANAPDIPTVDRYVGFMRELPGCPEDVLVWLPRKARAAARNARDKYGLEESVGDEHLRTVWRLYSLSMRRLGSLTYPFSFFDRLIAYTPGRHRVSIVHWNGRVVAGLVTFLFQDCVMPYFIGSTDDARRCGAANFIYWQAMTRGVAEGYRWFDFGRSRKDNTGSYDFKRFHGFTPRPLGYQVDIAPGHAGPNLSPSHPRFHLARRVWKHLPLRLTQTAGAILARHIPG